MNRRSQPEIFVDPALLTNTGGEQEHGAVAEGRAYVDSYDELAHDVDCSILQGNDNNGDYLPDSHFDNYNSFDGPVEAPQTPYYHPNFQHPITPERPSLWQQRVGLCTPALSSDTSRSKFDPQAPHFSPENSSWTPSVPSTPKIFTSNHIQQGPFASFWSRQRDAYDTAGCQDVFYAVPNILQETPSGGIAVDTASEGALPLSGGPSRAALQQYHMASEAPPMNVEGWERPGTPPSHDVDAWRYGQYTVSLPITQEPAPDMLSPLRRRPPPTGSRAPSSVGPSQSAASDSGSFARSCKSCGRIFDKQGKLNKHERYHRVGKLECSHLNKSNEQCQRNFHFQKDLDKHVRTHTGERPFKCPVNSCEYHDKGFTKKDNWHRHLSKQHPDWVAVSMPPAGTTM